MEDAERWVGPLMGPWALPRFSLQMGALGVQRGAALAASAPTLVLGPVLPAVRAVPRLADALEQVPALAGTLDRLAALGPGLERLAGLGDALERLAPVASALDGLADVEPALAGGLPRPHPVVARARWSAGRAMPSSASWPLR